MATETGKEGADKLAQILSLLEGASTRADAADKRDEERSKADAERWEAMSKRMDAFEQREKARCDAEEAAKKDAARKDAEKDEKDDKDDKSKADAEDDKDEKKDKDKSKADKGRKDAESEEADDNEKALKKERKENDLERNDSSRAGIDPALAKRIADLEARIPTELPENQRQRFAAIQLTAEPVYYAFGDAAGAPRWQIGETEDQYRRRLLERFKCHSSHWKDVDLSAFADKALGAVEVQIYADAMREATRPSNVTAGVLHMRVRADEANRQIREFYGDPEACWAPFKQQPMAVSGFTTKFN